MVVAKAVPRISLLLGGLLSVGLLWFGFAGADAATQQQTGSVGVEGTIQSPAPTQAPTISVPSNGESFSALPIKVSGFCQSGLLVEVFSNNVFSGSTQCAGGSYSLQIDLFSGRNDLVVRQYDALNQDSPDSATVTVTFNSTFSGNGPALSITSTYAKLGADPGSVLTWPLTLNGGGAPYAVSVDWGDKTAFELLSLSKAGDFNITHTYSIAGTYNVTIKVTDINGNGAFLQLVAVANGAARQGGAGSGGSGNANGTPAQKVVVWWPSILGIFIAIFGFWLGGRHKLETIRGNIRRGERPF